MKKNIFFMFVVLVNLVAVNYGFPVAFLGLKGEVAPAINKRLNEHVRIKMEMSEDISLYDHTLTERIKSEIDFSYNEVVSRELVDGLIRFRADSTLVIWGQVDNFNVEAKRRGFFRAEAVGQLRVTLHMYSLGFKTMCYVGTLTCNAKTPINSIGFSSIRKHAHINPRERERIVSSVIDTMSQISYQRAKAVLIHLRRKEQPQPFDEMEMQKAPTLDDLFDIPSGDASDVEGGNDGGSVVDDLFGM